VRRVWEALELTTPDLEARKQAMDELSESTVAGVQRRKAFRQAIEDMRAELQGLGIEMAQFYQSHAIMDDATSGKASMNDDSTPKSKGKFAAALEYVPTTQPGRRLPHAWLNSLFPKGPPISTHNLAGKTSFCLFTGHGGEWWKSAASHTQQHLKVPINAYSIGFGLDWQDVYFDLERVRGVGESGCILVRPDRFVAWRCPDVLKDENSCIEMLSTVLRRTLGWEAQN